VTSIPNGEVSASKFNTAFGRAGCGMKFYYRYIEGIRGVTNASLLAGIAYDQAARKMHDTKRDTGSVSVGEAHDTFIEAYENPPEENRDGEPVEYDLSDQPDDLLGRAENALKQYAEQVVLMDPVETQVFVEASFNETDAKLIGYVDVVERIAPGRYAITDVKTSLSSRKKWTVEEATRDTQLNIYAVLWQHQNPTETVDAVGWRHARLGGKVEVGATHVKPTGTQQTMERVAYWMGELERWCETGNFPATGLDRDAWVCSEKYCDYFHKCPFGSKSQTIIPITIGGSK